MIHVDAGKCDTCGTCVGVCPADALVIEFRKLTVHDDICIGCGGCVAVCPMEAIEED
jgi:MinD superfamily P-loop ATPase